MNTPENEPPGQNKEFDIVVNGQPKTITQKKLSYTEVVKLAFPDLQPNETTAVTVTYKRGEDKKPEGSLVVGDSVTVKSGMIFYVVATDKS